MNFQRQQMLDSLKESMTSAAIGIGIALILLVIGVYCLRSWFRDRDDLADGADQILDQMRELHDGGDLSEEEFRSIKSRIEKRTTP